MASTFTVQYFKLAYSRISLLLCSDRLLFGNARQDIQCMHAYGLFFMTALLAKRFVTFMGEKKYFYHFLQNIRSKGPQHQLDL